jgi:hypothetical protein
MSANINPGSTAPGVVHHATTFGRAGALSPTTCGRTEVPKPATDDWLSVTCAACLHRYVVFSRATMFMRLRIAANLEALARELAPAAAAFEVRVDWEPGRYEITSALGGGA